MWDFWKQQLLTSDGASLVLPLPSRSGRLFALRPAEAHPQLLGTAGHWSMDAREVPACGWHAETKTLSGRARGNAGDPTALFLHVPEGWTLSEASVGGNVVAASEMEKTVLRLDIPATDAPLPFAVTFEAKGVRKEAKPRAFEAGPAAQVTWSGPRLSQLLNRGGLVAYADCGGGFHYEKSGGPRLFRMRGRDYTFQQKDARPWFCSVLFDPRAVRYDVVGLDPCKRYELGWSWWDHNQDGRTESVTVTAPSKEKKVLVEAAVLPAWIEKHQPAEEQHAELPRELYPDGRLSISWSNEADVPNAVVSEVWLREL